ncbi:peptidoglycan-recognition protein LE-like isoform X5 [Pectinophora gossypiella]|uniref:peptidoglycan-recognition protein LE-like isoform X5 n=1 Tax=Pectinophora gossypiella TaxID=13191 RepID=UPI00214E1310|nr:peptidoglycan-recognition protein LE-like isoform X5 [Pectinophora gossypiella]
MAMKIGTVDERNLGIKVEGDLGDLQIIEEYSESDDEKNEVPGEFHKGTIANIPNNLVKASATPVFGTVAVTNSENVQFGNNTFFNGPVTIKQVIQTRSGIDNASYQKTEDENPPNGKFQPKNEPSFIGKLEIKTWHKLSLSAVGIILFGGVCAVVLIMLQRDRQQSGTTQPTGDNSSNDLLIAPDHLRIVSRTDWLAQPVEKSVEPIKLPVPWVIITHTATDSCFTQSACVLRVRLMQTFHIESRGWSDIGYNFLVGGDGSAYYGRGWDQIGAHTKGYNKYSIAIAFIGTFNSENPTKNQVEACKKLIKLGVAEGKLAKDYKLFAHRQLMSTLSPGDKVVDIIKTWPHFVNETDLTSLIPNY